MRPSWILLPLALVALAVLLLLVTGGRDDGSSGAIERAGRDGEELPLLRGRGREVAGETQEGEEEDDEVVEDGPAPGPQEWTRLHGTVRLRDTQEPVETGEASFLFLAPGTWSGTEEAFRALGAEARGHASRTATVRIGGDGTYAAQLPRGAVVHAAGVARPRTHDRVPLTFVPTARALWRRMDAPEVLLDLEAAPGLEIKGEVRDAGRGDPVVGVLVLRATETEPRAGARSKEDGSFRVTGLAEGDTYAPAGLVFEVTHPDFLTQRFRVRFDRASKAFPFVRVALVRGVRVGGRLTLNGESPQNAADVLLVKRGTSRVPWAEAEQVLARTRSDGEGRFRFPAIPPTAGVDLVVPPADGVHTGGGAGARVEGLDLTHDRDDLRADLVAVVQVPVRPVTTEGEVVGAKASHVFFEGVDGVLRRAGYRGGSDPVLWLVGLAPGHEHRIQVYAEVEDDRGLIRLWRGETVAVGGAAREVPVTLARWSFPGIPYEGPLQVQTCTVGSAWYDQHVWQLRVTDASTGRPIARRAFHVSTDTGIRTGTGLQDEGLVRISLPPGPARLRLQVEGYEPVDVTLAPREPGYEEQDLALTPVERRR